MADLAHGLACLLAVAALLALPFLVAFTPLDCWDRTRSAAFAVLSFVLFAAVCCLGVP